jgi:prepilin peptidase CpaA
VVIAATVVAVTTATAAAFDLRTRRVPNWLTFGVAAIGMAIAAARIDGVGVGGALAGLGLGLLLMLPGYAFGRTGAGDVKLLAAVGTLLGPVSIVTAFFYSAIAGIAFALIAAAGRREGDDHTFAYAPAIAVGTVIAAVWR